MKGWATLPLRLGVGIVFLAHGIQKAFGLFGKPTIAGFAKMLSGLGFAPPAFWAYLVAYTELLGGLFLLMGLLVRISSAALFVVMSVAVVKVHLAHGFFANEGGFEYNFIILCACFSLLISGQGKLGIPWFRKL